MGCKYSTIRDTQQEPVAAIEENKTVRAELSSDPIEESNEREKDIENAQSMTATEELPTQQACEELSLEDLNVNVTHTVSEVETELEAVTEVTPSSEPVKEPEPAEETVAPKMDVADLAIEPAAEVEAEPVHLKLTGHTITDTKVVYYTIQTPTSTIQRRYNDFKALYAAFQKDKKLPLMPSAYGSMRLIGSAPSIKMIKQREERFQSILNVIASDNALFSSDTFQQFLKEEDVEAQVAVEQPTVVETPAFVKEEPIIEAPKAAEEEATTEVPIDIVEEPSVAVPASIEEEEQVVATEAAEEINTTDVIQEESKDIVVTESIEDAQVEMPEEVEPMDEKKTVDVVPESEHDNNVDSNTHAVE